MMRMAKQIKQMGLRLVLLARQVVRPENYCRYSIPVDQRKRYVIWQLKGYD